MNCLLCLSVGTVVVTVAVGNRALTLIVSWMMMLTLIIIMMIIVFLTCAISGLDAQPSSVLTSQFKLNHFMLYIYAHFFTVSYPCI